jgi:predicted alpha-1,2-mannosidase
VHLSDQNIKVDLTVTKRAGFHKYTFAQTDSQYVLLNLFHRDIATDYRINEVSKSSISGFRISKAWAEEQHIYFYIEFSRAFDFSVPGPENEMAWYVFQNPETAELLVKVGISAVSIENAKANLEAEIPHWDFEQTKAEAQQAWNKQLGKIEVQGAEEDKVKFYTALYHTMIAPNLYTDVNGDYRGMDMKIHNTEGDKGQYTVFSLWDTFRATHPLFTIIEQDRTNAFVQTFLRQYEQGGLLPVWELAANETYCMIGYHSAPVIVDAYLKGIHDFDAEKALEAMVNSANQDHFGLEFYKKQGYISAGDESESVSKTLEYAYDDWCIARMAEAMGKDSLATVFYKRSENWKNLFDPETGFFRARVNNGWFSPFKPEEVNFNYTEANAWQYSLFVPHDIYGLRGLMPEGLESHLDNMFSESSETSGREQADITGLIGQYAHGNEPSHHMAYLGNYCGQPDKTQKLVHQIKETLYTTQPDGLSGNEDCGQMSAWYVLSALGFYSVTPGIAEYVIGTPTFKEATINLENGQQFTIRANNLSKENSYIQSATLGGTAYSKTTISHEAIMHGGELVFEMGREPSDWGKNQADWPWQKASENLLVPAPFFTTSKNTFKDSLQVGIASLCSECAIIAGYANGPSTTFENWNITFNLYKDSEIWAFAKHSDGGISDTIMTQFYKLDDKIKLTLHSKYANQYSAGGDNALIDRQYGTANFRTGSWQGYQGQDFKASLVLEKPQTDAQISIGFLQDIKSWIWYPKKVIVDVYESDDQISRYEFYPGKDLEKTEGAMRTTVKFTHKGRIEKVVITAESIGLCPEWHLGAGGESWLFLDEIEVKQIIK